MPSPLRRRAVRLLSRWLAVRRTGPRLPVVAVATAIAMVGALVLEPGIAARTPDEMTSPAVTTADVGVPRSLLIGHDQVPVLDGPWAYEVVPVPAMIAPLNLSVDVFLRAQERSPAAFVAWIRRYVGLAAELAHRTALAQAVAGTSLDPLRRFPVMVVLDEPPAVAHRAAPRHLTSKPPPRRTAIPNPPTRRGPGPDGSWNVAPIVTWYGPGFYGNRTACGQRYTRTIIGVAHRTLPCGTLVQFRWHGITAVAPVIDRGPYASAAYVFDWSAALACRVFKPRGVSNSCFTRHDVQWRIVGHRGR